MLRQGTGHAVAGPDYDAKNATGLVHANSMRVPYGNPDSESAVSDSEDSSGSDSESSSSTDNS